MPKPTPGNDEKQLIQGFSWKKGHMCDVNDLYKAHKDLRQNNGNSVAATLRHANKKSKKGEIPEMVTASKEAKRMAAAANSVGKTLVMPNKSSSNSVAQEECITSLRATIEGEESFYMPNE